MTLVAIGGNVLYGVDSTAFERALPAAADARSRLLERSRDAPDMIIWIRTRKGWVGGIFFALVAIFAISFIIGGVGTGSNASLSDIFGNDGGGRTSTTSQPASIGELQKTVKANPKNAQAWQQLADAYAARQQPATEAAAWGHVVALKPGNMDG